MHMSIELLSANHGARRGNTGGARNRKGRGFCSGVYPITPSTECMEYLCQQTIEKGRVVRVERAQCDGCVHRRRLGWGAQLHGDVFQRSRLYVRELHRCCVSALAGGLAVANRTMGPPWNIWADHGDALTLRDHGLIQFYCADNQELFDTVLSAFRLAEDKRVMMPVMVNMEGFILSHTVAQTQIPDQGQVDDFLPLTDIPHRLGEVPHTLGQMEIPHQTEIHRWQHHQAMLEVGRIYAEI